jgi:hypothetical protein
VRVTLQRDEAEELVKATTDCVSKGFLLAGVLAGDLGWKHAVIAILDLALAWRMALPLRDLKPQLQMARAALGGDIPHIGVLSHSAACLLAADYAWHVLDVVSQVLGQRVKDIPKSDDIRARYGELKKIWKEFPPLELATKTKMEIEIARELGWLASGMTAPRVTKPKHSTQKNEAREKIIGALNKYHQYENGWPLNNEPIGNNVLAREATVAKSTASAFILKEFGGRTSYEAACRNKGPLAKKLQALNGEECSGLEHFGDSLPEEDEIGLEDTPRDGPPRLHRPRRGSRQGQADDD